MVLNFNLFKQLFPMKEYSKLPPQPHHHFSKQLQQHNITQNSSQSNYLCSNLKKTMCLRPNSHQTRPRKNTTYHQDSQKQRDHSPTISSITTQQYQFFQKMEISLLSQNKNLQEQNVFLTNQIKTMFQKQKKYVHTLRKYKSQHLQLLNLNKELQHQLTLITQNTLEEINRIQQLLKNDKNGFEDDLMIISQSSAKKSSTVGFQTQTTIHNNLEQLRHQLSSIGSHSISFGKIQTDRQSKVKTLRRTRPDQTLSPSPKFNSNEIESQQSDVEQHFSSYLPSSSCQLQKSKHGQYFLNSRK